MFNPCIIRINNQYYILIANMLLCDMKKFALNLIEKSSSSYKLNKISITELSNKFENIRQIFNRNTIILHQLEILQNPNGHLLGGVLKKWELEDKLSPIFIADIKKTVSNAFDLIIKTFLYETALKIN